MLDLLLIFSLGFLGSFGHCVGMCGPLAAAFALSQSHTQMGETPDRCQRVLFHGLLNLGRLISYTLVGAAIGALGSVLIAGGQVAGIGSSLRQAMTILTGVFLVWFGVVQINPRLLPHIPFVHPLLQDGLHQRLGNAMTRLSMRSHPLTPLLLGTVWGLIPCGFLYAAQIKAAETGSLWRGGATLLAFGLGTLPMMLGIGVSASALSGDRRSQLFRLGGWVTLTIGLLTLFRSGDLMADYTGHGALILLALALVARPLSRCWSGLLQVRRGLGVGAFVLAIAHTAHMLEHSWGWNLHAFWFMVPQHRWGIGLGAIALSLMVPLALTSIDSMQRRLGQHWRTLHLLAVPALLLAGIHCILTGASYLGSLHLTGVHWLRSGLVGLLLLAVLLLRSPQFWAWLALQPYYAAPLSSSAAKVGTPTTRKSAASQAQLPTGTCKSGECDKK